MSFSAKTHKGLVRKKNEDYFFVDENKGLYVIADGMGGHNGGELASRMAVEYVAENFIIAADNHVKKSELDKLVKKIVQKSNEYVYQKSKENSELEGMGTTLTLAVLRNDRVHLYHVGDSRAYMISSGEIKQLTTDHTLVEVLLKNGDITEEEAKNHPKKHIITRAIGSEELIIPDMYEYKIVEEDLLILCTDGVTNHIEEHEMLEIFRDKSLDESCDTIIDLANERGGRDNITLIALKYAGNEEMKL